MGQLGQILSFQHYLSSGREWNDLKMYKTMYVMILNNEYKDAEKGYIDVEMKTNNITFNNN